MNEKTFSGKRQDEILPKERTPTQMKRKFFITGLIRGFLQ